jgi:cysteinyl-tRNA synthetase
MRWNSPWGEGFPGWHLECSVMSTKYLGETFDIHGGGRDLKFPHHECEIAQNKAANGKDGVRYWMHGNMLTLNGQRMSKSTGNTLLPAELFSGNTSKLQKGFSPTVVRFFMMQAHYGSQLDFSNDALMAAEKGFNRLRGGHRKLQQLQPGGHSDFKVAPWRQSCYDAMNDDFNSPVLISQLFEAVRFINGAKTKACGLSEDDLALLQRTFEDFTFDVLGLEKPEAGGDSGILEAAMDTLIYLRNRARADKNWELADQIRDQLAENGIQLKDGPEGTTYSLV